MRVEQLELEGFRRDTAYFEAHQQELLEEYPEQWIAILDQRIVGTASDARQLLNDLKARGVPLGRTLIEHLTRNEDILILPG